MRKRNLPPVCEIIKPENNIEVADTSTLLIEIEANDPEDELAAVRVFLNNEQIDKLNVPPFTTSVSMAGRGYGKQTIAVEATDKEGLSSSDEILIDIYKAEIPHDTSVIPSVGLMEFSLSSNIYNVLHPSDSIGWLSASTRPYSEIKSFALVDSSAFPHNRFFKIKGKELLCTEQYMTLGPQYCNILIEATNEYGTRFLKEFTIVKIIRRRHIEIYETTYPPFADGVINDVEEPWRADWTDLFELEKATDIDATAQFIMTYDIDLTNLWIAIKVQHKDTLQAESYLKGDRLELYISMETEDGLDGNYTEGCWMISMNFDQYPNLTHNHFSGYQGADSTDIDELLDHEDFHWGLKRHAGEDVIEIGLPFEVLAKNTNFKGEKFLFDIAFVNYDEGNWLNSLYWASNSGKQKYDTKELGEVIMAGQEKIY